MKMKKSQVVYFKPFWAVYQLIRETGLLEDVCEHGVGHPNREWLNRYDSEGTRYLGIHGCDGCCCIKSLDKE